jgi:PAS domain S-box-containing protein
MEDRRLSAASWTSLTVPHDSQVLPTATETVRAGANQSGLLERRLLAALRSHAVFALDDSGCIATWTEPAARLTGYPADAALRQPLTLLLSSTSQMDIDRVLAAARETGTHQQEQWWKRSDGRLVWVDEVIHPVEGGGYVVVARDATDRADQAEHALASTVREAEGAGRESALRREIQAAERQASFLAEASSILVATSLDFDSTLKALARLAVSRLAEWCVLDSLDDDGELRRAEIAHRDPALERALERMIAPALHTAWDQVVRTVLSTGQSQTLDGIVDSSWFQSENGAAPDDDVLRQISRGAVMVTPLMGRGRVLGAITFVAADNADPYNDDDLVLAEELGRRAAIALDNARLYRAAQEANRAKSDFLAVISHELRTPLNAIMGYSDLLDAEISGDLTDKQRRQISRIRASARHLLQLIEEILSFARIEAGGDEVRPQPVSAHELLQEAAAVIEPLAEAKSLAFVLEEDAPDISVETDAGKARQVLVNLLSNAVKFTERGKVGLRVRSQGEHVVFEVSDTGVGISPDQVSRIFDPFWQAEHPNTRRAGGTGLGLSVSRRYTRLLHGELKVDSHPGRGTTFFLILPMRFTATPGRNNAHAI